MNKHAAISASLVDVRNIAAHKCVRLEIHVPVEQANQVFEAFGWPTAVDPIPVAIARLAIAQDKPSQQKIHKTKSWDELRLSQQAAIRCSDETYRHWLCVDDEESAKAQVRKACQVDSRAELDTDPDAAGRWHEMEAEFATWKRVNHF